ncbi:MAG TPA: tetratricopeptide repeat protein [Thermoanaerobaculia bacterium]|nr:tetratricopeptide repeat protein [Thermoanaerobaculia bacterium]
MARVRSSFALVTCLLFTPALFAQPPAASPRTPPTQQAPPATAPAPPAPAAPDAGDVLPEQPEAPPFRVLRTGGLHAQTAALLLSGRQGGPIPFALLAMPLPGDAEKARVPVLIEIDGSTLLDKHEGNPLRIEVAIYAAAAGGKVQGTLMDTVEIDLDPLGVQIDQGGVKYLGELELPPGEYSLRLLVRNPATDSVGLRALLLKVPAFASSGPVLLPPLFAERQDLWLLVKSASGGKGRASALSGLVPGDLPAVEPVLEMDQTVSFRFAAWRLDKGSSALRLTVNKVNGPQVGDFPLEVTGREPSGMPGLEIISARFEPHGLPVGEYELRPALSGATEPEVLIPFGTSFFLVDGKVRGRVWAEFGDGRKGDVTAEQARQETARKVRRRIKAGPIEAAYRQALARLAQGDESAAQSSISELETSLIMGKEPIEPEDLAAIELDIAAEVAKSNPEGLVPLLMLHGSLYRDYLSRRTYALSSHTRELVFRMADLYAERSGTPEARKLGARFVIGLAADLARTAPRVMRERAFRRALRLDEGNAPALLGLAVDAERHGEYEQAVEYLQNLLKNHPDYPEAKLRLALNSERRGYKREAQQLLQEVLGGTSGDAGGDRGATVPEPWLQSLAYQELGRMQMDAKDFDQAEKTLREGRQRLPEEEKLALQLALLLDLRRRSSEAKEVLEGLTLRADMTQQEASPRHRYNQPPYETLDREWIGLRESASERRPALAKAVRVAPAKEGSR